KVHANEPEGVERFRISCSSAYRLFEPRCRLLHLPPARSAPSAFERARFRVRRDARGLVVGTEGFLEAMHQLERMAELDPRDRIVRQPALELLHLSLRPIEIAGRGEHADIETPRVDVFWMLGQLLSQRLERLRLAMHADELRGPLNRRRCPAPRQKAE